MKNSTITTFTKRNISLDILSEFSFLYCFCLRFNTRNTLTRIDVSYAHSFQYLVYRQFFKDKPWYTYVLYHFQKKEENPDLKFFSSPIFERLSPVLRASRTQTFIVAQLWWATFFRKSFNLLVPLT